MDKHTLHVLQRGGTSHRFNQDRFRVWRSEDRLILTIADGHGGKPYTRSGLGARFACEIATGLLRTDIAPCDFPAALKQRWDDSVRKHLAFHPLEDWELQRARGLPPQSVYGTTFLAAVLKADRATIYQLGDGDTYIINPDGNLFSNIPDPACCGNLTISLCQSPDTILRHFRIMDQPGPAGAVMLHSDGCEGALLRALPGLLHRDSTDAYLEQMLTLTDHGDDQTFLLAYHRDLTDSDVFRTNLSNQICSMHRENRRRRQQQKDSEEYTRLKAFLNKALIKANSMVDNTARDAYKLSLQPSILRFLELQKLLGIQT